MPRMSMRTTLALFTAAATCAEANFASYPYLNASNSPSWTFPEWVSTGDPSYGPYLSSNVSNFANGSVPWGTRDVFNTNPYTDTPTTGVTRTYDFTVSRGMISPDGYEREGILINGQYPGPLIEANWGDMIQVVVHNNITNPEEGTALHWHGLRQRGTPWYDGVPAVTQCPIAPGSSFVYEFRADSYGTTWYHSHYDAQYADGLAGPMLIYGPSHVPYEIDLGPIMVSDYSHRGYSEIVADVVSVTTNFSVFVPGADNNLINGKMPYNCSGTSNTTLCNPKAAMSQFNFESGKTYRLRLINTGAADVQRFSIDNHTLQVIANDFTPLIPYETDVVTLGIGQRSDVLVSATGQPGQSYWMRSTIAHNCTETKNRFAQAMVIYEGAAPNAIPISAPYFLPELNCANDNLSLTVPAYPITPDSIPSTTEVLELNFTQNTTGHNIFVWNNLTHYADYNVPILGLANEGNDSYPADPLWNIYDFGSNSSIRIVINNLYVAMHPIHMHGHSMYILSEGDGPWDGVTITNPQNPNRRDVQQLRRLGHLVIQIDADNPGVWPLHCHIAWHQSMGMTINVMERTDKIHYPELPGILDETCVAWNEWTSRNVVDQIDAGTK